MELNNVKEAGATEVLVVGAGPTGLVLGIELARRGVRVVVLEKGDRLFPGSRGSGLQPRTLEVFDDLGVLDAVMDASEEVLSILPWSARGEPGEPYPIAERTAATERTPYPNARTIPQWRTQEILYARLRELGGEVRFGTGVTGLEQDADGVTVRLSDGGALRAAYVVGADGGRSTVRAAIGVTMDGENVDPTPKLVADLYVDGLDREHWHGWMPTPQEAVVIRPFPGMETYQLFANFAEADARPDTSADGVRKLIAERTHLPADAVGEVVWASVFRARAALADRFQVGRVFLAGDAAHIHSPAGGQGLNTSVQDAYNLGWKLGQVLRFGAPARLLETYEAERRPVAVEVLGRSTAIHREGVVSPGARQARGPELRQLGLGYRGGPLSVDAGPADAGGPMRAGDRAPDAVLADGSRLFDALRGPHFTLLTADAVPEGLPSWIRVHRTDAYGPGVFLIRPDGYVALTADETAAVTSYLTRVSG